MRTWKHPMMPPENPKDVSIVKDGDRWVAIIDSVRFGGFRSEEAARRFVRAFCYGEYSTPTLAHAIGGLKRARSYGEYSIRFAPNDHMREINKRSAELTERYWRNEIMKLLDAEGER
jgi:hypothetical protein